MNKKFFCFLVSLLLIISPSFAADLTLENLIEKIQVNQSKITDMYAETTTTMTSSIAMPGSKSKGPQTMVQKGKMWTKGKDKSKIEMLSPMKQTTITNGDQMAIINPETGQKMIQDLSKMEGRQGMAGQSGEMDLEKAREYFDLSVSTKKSEDGKISAYVIKGVPKEVNKFLGKMEFHIDPTRWVPTKVLMYNSKGKIMSQSEIEYASFAVGKKGSVYVPLKNSSNVNTPAGKMKVEMVYGKIKVNKGIKDTEFKI
ncbi:outer membrane lipoprotein carrier protein LolA [Candidatus Margulisiibacteriota bacterium]